MKVRLSIAIAFTFLLASSAARAQASDAPPPIRMGLWQSETTSTFAGAPGSPLGQALGHGGHTVVSQGCLTPETWKDEMEHLNQQAHRSNCTMSNFQQDTHKVSFDEQCSADHGFSTQMHFEMLIDSAESAHGDGEMKMTGPAFPDGMTMHMALKTKFLSSDCGDVKPGEGKVISR